MCFRTNPENKSTHATIHCLCKSTWAWFIYVRMHTCFVKLGRQAWNQKLLQQTVAHTAGNIHEMHKHVFVFGVESLHLLAQDP